MARCVSGARCSSYSGNEGGARVEIATAPGAVFVRDSNDPDGPHPAFRPEKWSASVRLAVGR